MSQPDLGQILAQAQQMQARLADLQRSLALRSVEASAGGGMVTAVATIWPINSRDFGSSHLNPCPSPCRADSSINGNNWYVQLPG